MKVDNPTFDIDERGELSSCHSCPIEQLPLTVCGEWLHDHGRRCPTSETYADACEFAEEAAP